MKLGRRREQSLRRFLYVEALARVGKEVSEGGNCVPMENIIITGALNSTCSICWAATVEVMMAPLDSAANFRDGCIAGLDETDAARR